MRPHENNGQPSSAMSPVTPLRLSAKPRSTSFALGIRPVLLRDSNVYART
jgi:hypothetical protein